MEAHEDISRMTALGPHLVDDTTLYYDLNHPLNHPIYICVDCGHLFNMHTKGCTGDCLKPGCVCEHFVHNLDYPVKCGNGGIECPVDGWF